MIRAAGQGKNTAGGRASRRGDSTAGLGPAGTKVTGPKERAGRALEPGVEGRGLAVIAIEVEHLHRLVPFGQLIEQLRSPVGAAIIDEQDFKCGGSGGIMGLEHF